MFLQIINVLHSTLYTRIIANKNKRIRVINLFIWPVPMGIWPFLALDLSTYEYQDSKSQWSDCLDYASRVIFLNGFSFSTYLCPIDYLKYFLYWLHLIWWYYIYALKKLEEGIQNFHLTIVENLKNLVAITGWYYGWERMSVGFIHND